MEDTLIKRDLMQKAPVKAKAKVPAAKAVRPDLTTDTIARRTETIRMNIVRTDIGTGIDHHHLLIDPTLRHQHRIIRLGDEIMIHVDKSHSVVLTSGRAVHPV